MVTIILNSLEKLKANPRSIFLIDAIGALITALFLLGILAQLENYFGMPSKVLYLLSVIAFCLFLYSISCHRLIKSNGKPFLSLLIFFNLIYLLISIGMVIKYYVNLTKLGVIYFILELIIIGIVIIIELKAIKR